MSGTGGIREVGRRLVFCKNYAEGIEYLLDKYEDYPNPIDDWREYTKDDEKIVVVMTPIGDLWIFEVSKVGDEYAINLIGYSYALRLWLDKRAEEK